MRVSSEPECGGAHKLAYLPSTNDAFNGNVAVAHLQVTVLGHEPDPEMSATGTIRGE